MAYIDFKDKSKMILHNSILCKNDPDTVLGIWIINHQCHSVINCNGEILIEGSFDVNIWYSYSEDSKTEVHIETMNYTYLPTSTPIFDDDYKIKMSCTQQPTILNNEIVDGYCEVEIETEFYYEVTKEERKMEVHAETSPEFELIVGKHRNGTIFNWSNGLGLDYKIGDYAIAENKQGFDLITIVGTINTTREYVKAITGANIDHLKLIRMVIPVEELEL